MARHTKVAVVPFSGRDKGKHFLITEMPASKAEKWAARAIMALAHSGVEIPEDMQNAGMAVIAVVGIRALASVSFAEAEPLMDEMFDCIQAMPDPKQPAIVRQLVEDDIEETATRAWLRSEVLEVHTGFSIADAVLTSLQNQDDARPKSGPMSMFRRPSAPSSQES